MIGTVFLRFYFSVLMTVAVMGCIESWLNPHNVYSSFLRVFILQDSLMGLAFMVMHVCAYHLSIFYLQSSVSAYICILPPRETPSQKCSRKKEKCICPHTGITVNFLRENAQGVSEIPTSSHSVRTSWSLSLSFIFLRENGGKLKAA